MMQAAWSNLVAYWLQVTMLVAASALAAWVFRVSPPRARLIFWQAVLACCLLLPAVQPWERRIVIARPVSMAAPARESTPAPATPLSGWSPLALAFEILAAGAGLRLSWIGLGLLRLRRYRQRSRDLAELDPQLADLRNALAPTARLCLSDEVRSPVTFGAVHPVVLLPAVFPDLDPRAQRAIVCHELLHVSRGDWLFTVAEEALRAIFWFHPAIWWLLGQVQLSREQTVDREAVAITDSRNEYLDALLAIAGGRPQPDLAPAPLFLRRRHLKKRVASILMEARMSKARLTAAVAASAMVLLAAAWISVGAFPLAAAPQAVADAEGVSVEVGAATLAHRAGVNYPDAARAAGVQGVVALEALLAANGTVSDVRVLSGPEALRAAALEAALQFHFTRATGAGWKQISITFALPKDAASPKPSRIVTRFPAPPAGAETVIVKAIQIRGLSAAAEQELRALLPLSDGGTLTVDSWRKLEEAVQAYDEHLIIGLGKVGTAEVTINIIAPPGRATSLAGGVRWFSSAPGGQQRDVIGGVISGGPVASAEPASPSADGKPPIPTRIRVGGNVQASKLTSQTPPEYPPLAKQARIQGVVKMEAIIDNDGKVVNVHILSGHPLLAPAAMEAVRQWQYAPTLLNGQPVQVLTQVDVNFTLPQQQ
jgi:TonB family protein